MRGKIATALVEDERKEENRKKRDPLTVCFERWDAGRIPQFCVYADTREVPEWIEKARTEGLK